MICAEQGTLRYRQIYALSWRVASELARRDKSVYIGLTSNGGSEAHADALMLARNGEYAYQARRCGLGFVTDSFELPWERALGMRSPHEIAMELEAARGITYPTSPHLRGRGLSATDLPLPS
ncbi:hypothetical protein D6T65_13485 [Arthrobacter frigidicola]|nr:hypothetical protein D6T65_13485 [Arthrobacter frigidicola]